MARFRETRYPMAAGECRTGRQTQMNIAECDPVSGVCTPAPAGGPDGAATQAAAGAEVVYVGDPMCSWCWGIAPAVRALQRHCAANGVPFRVVVGGLRPGGGDPWNAQFRNFLEHHWHEVSQRTGQPFSYRLLQRAAFEYDTEPACRAVVAARPLILGSELEFFAAVQRRFYVDNEDPTQIEFYRDICATFGIDFEAFAERFRSAAVRAATREEFNLNRRWGVTGYPTVLLRAEARQATLAVGFATFEELRDRLERALPQFA